MQQQEARILLKFGRRTRFKAMFIFSSMVAALNYPKDRDANWGGRLHCVVQYIRSKRAHLAEPTRIYDLAESLPDSDHVPASISLIHTVR